MARQRKAYIDFKIKKNCVEVQYAVSSADANGLPLLDESWKTNHITNPVGDNIGQPFLQV